jgi:hypothetical protein
MEKVQLPTTPYPLASVPVYDRTRDEFAMAALTGLLAANWNPSIIPEQAYTLADAMLKQREAS